MYVNIYIDNLSSKSSTFQSMRPGTFFPQVYPVILKDKGLRTTNLSFYNTGLWKY